jgi:hypothetical protein
VFEDLRNFTRGLCDSCGRAVNELQEFQIGAVKYFDFLILLRDKKFGEPGSYGEIIKI